MGIFSRSAQTPKNTEPLSKVLRERGYIYQHSSDLEEIADRGQRTAYEGFDPSADSLHVGNLMGLLVLRRFLEAGHKVILVIGGGTGMIGDPSGKSDERVLLTPEQVAYNSKRIAAQAKKILGSDNFKMVNNAEWLGQEKLLEFLRDIGKHFSVNAMIQRDSVKERLDAREQGISYTEFSYMLLQAYDFLHLHDKYGCDWQHGSSDQWGNIVSGIDLIRRKTGRTAYGTTHGLLINKSTGKKFGKSEGGAVWLDAEKTSPSDFYQFWYFTVDEDIEEYLLKMTLLPKVEIDEIMKIQQTAPEQGLGQRKLAYEVTALVHGKDEADKAEKISSTLSSRTGHISYEDVDIPALSSGKLRDTIKDFSTSELRRLIAQGAVSSMLTGNKITSVDAIIEHDVIRIGKNKIYKFK